MCLRRDCTIYEVTLDLVKGVESIDKLAAKRATLHMVVNGGRKKTMILKLP